MAKDDKLMNKQSLIGTSVSASIHNMQRTDDHAVVIATVYLPRGALDMPNWGLGYNVPDWACRVDIRWGIGADE